MIENFEFYQKDEGFNRFLLKYRERKLNMTEEH